MMPITCAPPCMAAEHSSPHVDRVGVGDQRVVHGVIVLALVMPVANRVPEQHERVDREPGDCQDEQPEEHAEIPTIGTRLTRSASQPIGTARARRRRPTPYR